MARKRVKIYKLKINPQELVAGGGVFVVVCCVPQAKKKM